MKRKRKRERVHENKIANKNHFKTFIKNFHKFHFMFLVLNLFYEGRFTTPIIQLVVIFTITLSFYCGAQKAIRNDNKRHLVGQQSLFCV